MVVRSKESKDEEKKESRKVRSYRRVDTENPKPPSSFTAPSLSATIPSPAIHPLEELPLTLSSEPHCETFSPRRVFDDVGDLSSGKRLDRIQLGYDLEKNLGRKIGEGLILW